MLSLPSAQLHREPAADGFTKPGSGAGEDDSSGGGSEAGLDARQTYRLDFTGITAHPVQGFHVKLTIDAEGSQGADTKHKVFWVTGCNPGYPGSPPSAQ